MKTIDILVTRAQPMAMAGYTKLFNSILASTIWRANDKTRIVWITLLAMADKDGIAEGSVPGLADFSRVSIEDCESALKELSAPDKHSRSSEYEGRRIEAIDGVGWRLLNHPKYRAKMSEDERREYNRLKQAEWRSRQKMSTSVIDSQSLSAMSAQAEADTQAQAQESNTLSSKKRTSVRVNPDFDAFWRSYPKRVGKGAALKAWCKQHGQMPPLTELLTSLEAQKFSPAWQQEDGRFIPNPATWINQTRWADQPGIDLPKPAQVQPKTIRLPCCHYDGRVRCSNTAEIGSDLCAKHAEDKNP